MAIFVRSCVGAGIELSSRGPVNPIATRETLRMNTRLVMKLSAVAVALLVNGLVLGGAAYLLKRRDA